MLQDAIFARTINHWEMSVIREWGCDTPPKADTALNFLKLFVENMSDQ